MALTMREIVEEAKQGLVALVEKQLSSVTAVFKDEEGWHVSLEVVERKAIPDRMDLLAGYDVLLDEDGNILKFDRRELRTRGEPSKVEQV